MIKLTEESIQELIDQLNTCANQGPGQSREHYALNALELCKEAAETLDGMLGLVRYKNEVIKVLLNNTDS